jgi:inhibitor of KinA
VGITGKQTGIYPDELPGGWRIVGRTPLRIVDLDSAYFPIAPGDVVSFRPINAAEYRELEGSRL